MGICHVNMVTSELFQICLNYFKICISHDSKKKNYEKNMFQECSFVPSKLFSLEINLLKAYRVCCCSIQISLSNKKTILKSYTRLFIYDIELLNVQQLLNIVEYMLYC